MTEAVVLAPTVDLLRHRSYLRLDLITWRLYSVSSRTELSLNPILRRRYLSEPLQALVDPSTKGTDNLRAYACATRLGSNPADPWPGTACPSTFSELHVFRLCWLQVFLQPTLPILRPSGMRPRLSHQYPNWFAFTQVTSHSTQTRGPF